MFIFFVNLSFLTKTVKNDKLHCSVKKTSICQVLPPPDKMQVKWTEQNSGTRWHNIIPLQSRGRGQNVGFKSHGVGSKHVGFSSVFWIAVGSVPQIQITQMWVVGESTMPFYEDVHYKTIPQPT